MEQDSRKAKYKNEGCVPGNKPKFDMENSPVTHI